MTKQRQKTTPKLKLFDVTYGIEKAFSIDVKAASADEAERIVKRRLDDECDVLKGSTRVHYDGFIARAQEVRS